MEHLLIAGGDRRFSYLADSLCRIGYTVTVCGFNRNIKFDQRIEHADSLKDAAAAADVIILPLPVSTDGITINTPLSDGCFYLSELCLNAKKDALLIGGKPDRDLFSKYGKSITDYAERDDFAYLNAVPTAEGAIEAAMQHKSTTISGSKCIVTGFGRIGKILSLMLRGIGAKVWVCARSTKDLSCAAALGLNTVRLSEMNLQLQDADIVFNTVNAVIFRQESIAVLPKHCPIIDVASYPGGVDLRSADEQKIKTLFLPGLPGKYAPVTAAEIIRTTVTNIISESRKDANNVF